jgi:hypothetical protein
MADHVKWLARIEAMTSLLSQNNMVLNLFYLFNYLYLLLLISILVMDRLPPISRSRGSNLSRSSSRNTLQSGSCSTLPLVASTNPNSKERLQSRGDFDVEEMTVGEMAAASMQNRSRSKSLPAALG